MLEKILPYVEKILRYANEIFVIKDKENKIVFVNDKIKEYGYNPYELIGKSYLCLLSSKHKGRRFKKIVEGKIFLNYEVEFVTSDGKIVEALESNSPICDDNGDILFVVSILTDISRYKKLQKRLLESTYMDYLTGLYNVRYFYKRIGEEIKRANRKRENIAVVLIDIDNFKKYNDFFGHEEGNRLLKEFGNIIKSSIREGIDIGFRFGGDEFIILVTQAEKNGIMRITSRIRQKFLALNTQFLDLSMGISYYEPGEDVRSLIVKADQNLYKAKVSQTKIVE